MVESIEFGGRFIWGYVGFMHQQEKARMILRLIIAFALLLIVLQFIRAEAKETDRSDRTTVIRSQCIGDRCAIYNRKGYRIGSATHEPWGRTTIRDKRGRIVARVEER